MNEFTIQYTGFSVTRRLGYPPILEIDLKYSKSNSLNLLAVYLIRAVFAVELYSIEKGNFLKHSMLGNFELLRPIIFDGQETQYLQIPLNSSLVNWMVQNREKKCRMAFRIESSNAFITFARGQTNSIDQIENLSILNTRVSSYTNDDGWIDFIIFSELDVKKMLEGIQYPERMYLEIPIKAVNPKNKEFQRALHLLNSIGEATRAGNYEQVMINSRKLITLELMEKPNKEYQLKQSIRKELLRGKIQNAAKVENELIKCKESVLRGILRITNIFLHASQDEIKEIPHKEQAEYVYFSLAHTVSTIGKDLIPC